MSHGTFLDTTIRWEAFKKIFVLRPKIDFFFQGVCPGFLVKNDQILEAGIFHFFMSLGISACRKTSLGIILRANNTLTKTFWFNSHPDFIFCGIFLRPWSLGRPKNCLMGRFWIQRFDWNLLKEYLSCV